MSDSATENIMGMEPEKGRWILVLLGLIINLCLGTIYSWSVFVAPLTAYFTKTLGQTVTASDVLLPFSVFLAFFAIAMPFTGKYIEQYGPRNVTIVGGVLTGLGWLLASFATSVPMLYIVYGVIGGIGVGIAYGVPVAVAARWFPDRRGLAVGLTVLGFGFSAFFTANIAGWLITTYGVMTTFRIFGVAFVILTILLALPLRFPKAGWTPRGWTAPAPVAGQAVTCEFKREQMLRSRSFYGVWLCYFIGCLAGLMAISIAKPVGTDVGVEAGLATLLVGFFAIFNGFGRPVFGAVTDKFTPRNAAMISFVLIGLGSLLLWQFTGVLVYIVGVCPALGLPWRMACDCTGNHRVLLRDNGLPAVLRSGLPRLRSRSHCRAPAGRVHQDLDRVLSRGLPHRARPRGDRVPDRLHDVEAAMRTRAGIIPFLF